ncbi:Gfo/Idh/MocA family oxidoreductase [soil metagenome]
MTSASAIPVGVIGVGSLGFHHARILREVAGAEMVGIYDSDVARLLQVSSELGIRAFSSAEELAANVEAAVIAVPTTQHSEVALVALDRDVHLLIEKPIAATLAEADEILQRAEARGLLTATGQVERFNGAIRACEPYLDDPRFIESHRLGPFGPRGTDVAVVLDLMIHDIDLVLGLVGHPVSQVDAVGVPVLTPSVDIANARLLFETGAVANITASRISRDRVRKIRLFQNSGYMSLDLSNGTGEFLRLRAGFSPGKMAGAPSIESIVERVEFAGDGKEPLRAELESFVAAVQGKVDVVVSGRAGRDALAVALEIVNNIEKNVAHQRSS